MRWIPDLSGITYSTSLNVLIFDWIAKYHREQSEGCTILRRINAPANPQHQPGKQTR